MFNNITKEGAVIVCNNGIQKEEVIKYIKEHFTDKQNIDRFEIDGKIKVELFENNVYVLKSIFGNISIEREDLYDSENI